MPAPSHNPIGVSSSRETTTRPSGDEDLHVAGSDRLRAARQRYSTGRRAIVAVLAQMGRPVTAPEIVSQDKDLSVSSVYRNLAVLEAAEVVRRLVTQDETARYELAEEFTLHHHHLVCETCGLVADYVAPAQLEREMSNTLDSLRDDTGFAPRAHHVQILGLCAVCRRAHER